MYNWPTLVDRLERGRLLKYFNVDKMDMKICTLIYFYIHVSE
jgi:hypothetical protein